MDRAKENQHVSRQDNFDASKGTDVLSKAAIRNRAEAIATTNLFGAGTPVERATTVVTEATSAATALTSTSRVGMQAVPSILLMLYQQFASAVVVVSDSPPSLTLASVSIDPLLVGRIFRDFLLSTRQKKTPIPEKIKKLGGIIAHEYTMHFHVKDSVSPVPFHGGKIQIWNRAIQKKGGNSPRYTWGAYDHVRNTVEGSSMLVPDEEFKWAASYVGPILVTYKHESQLIVTSPEYQLLLQQTSMMSGPKMMLFNRLLVEMTGISSHSKSTTLATLQDKQMPDYTISMVKILVNKIMQPQRVFRVGCCSQVIELRVFKLFKNEVFHRSSLVALLDDSMIIVSFGGDKGGKKMAFKRCIAVVNAPKQSSSAAQDPMATLEVFDK
jgi:hypothetical protein